MPKVIVEQIELDLRLTVTTTPFAFPVFIVD